MSIKSIVVSGFSRQAAYLAGLLNVHVPELHVAAFGYDRGRGAMLGSAAAALMADAAITIGGPGPIALMRSICEMRRRPVIHMWVGSDVLHIAHSPDQLERLRLLNVTHWAVSPGLVEELAGLGIRARHVGIASAAVPQQLRKLPEHFTVLAYLPSPRRDFYGQQCIWAAARALPDARFFIVGAGAREISAPPNVSYVGEVHDMNRWIDDTCVLVRFAQHDGFSQNVVEALARGRHVIWNHEYPGVIRATSTPQVLIALQALHEAHVGKHLGLNEAGIACAMERHAPQSVARDVYAQIVRETDDLRVRERTDSPVKRVAISGSPMFSARVAENCRTYTPAILAQPLSTRTSSETAASLLALLKSEAWYTIGEPAAPHSLEWAARAWRKRRIVHWLGNDVDTLAGSPSSVRMYRSRRYVHLAQSADVANRLRGFGLHATVVSLAVLPRVEHVSGLPDRFTLLLYLPAERPELFGQYQYERLMSVLRDQPVSYIIVGGGKIDVPAGICAEQFGWQHELTEIYRRCTALVRITQTDSFSAMVVEALMHGRHVLWSNEFPYVVTVRNFHELERGVRSLLSRHQTGELRPCVDAAAAMRELYNPETCLNGLVAACAPI